MEASRAPLSERVDSIISSYKGTGARPLLATTDIPSAIRELIARSEGLERAVREIALDIQRLDAAQEREAVVMTEPGKR
jgi:hypothetical protein